MAEVLSCPFCGEIPEIESGANSTLIRCMNDDCGEVNLERADFEVDDEDHRSAAIAAWNRRSPSAPQAEGRDTGLPINTAPTDGTPVLVWLSRDKRWVIANSKVMAHAKASAWPAGWDWPLQATMWMPLPREPRDLSPQEIVA